MQKIFLIACVKKKAPTESRAEELYVSPLFRLSLKYAKSKNPGAIYILSAKHGLLTLDERISPYEETLVTKKQNEIRLWAEKVKNQLEKSADLEKDEFVFLAGEKYQRALTPFLKHTHSPLAGMGLGKRLKFLKEAVSHV